MVHAPFGCSVWPAWWSQSPTWPTGGEIDTLENISQAVDNQVSLHTNPRCNLDKSAIFTGNVISPDCSATDNNNSKAASSLITAQVHSAFSANSGGVFVTEYTDSYIAYFSRAKTPSALSDDDTTSQDTTTVGELLVNLN